MIPKECKRLAEVDFPIAVVSKHAAREKSIRHGHPSTLHLWWARRPLAACRAMLCALLWPDPCETACPEEFKTKARTLLAKVQGRPGAGDLELRKALLRFIGDFANWDLSAHPAYLELARGLVKAAHGDEPPLVADPFAGGGSIPLEALRLGCDAFASDLNPVACLILKVMLEDIPRHGPGLADELRAAGEEIKRQAEKELAEFYPTDPDGAKPIAYLWARTVRCESPNCGAEIPLMRSFWLCKKANRKRALRYEVHHKGTETTERNKRQSPCPLCLRGEFPHVVFEIFEPKNDREVPGGTVSRAKATCLCCGNVLPPDRVRAQLAAQHGGADVVFAPSPTGRGQGEGTHHRTGGARLLAVVTLRDNVAGRHYRAATDADYAAVWKAQQRLREVASTKLPNGLNTIPDEPTPVGGGSGAGRAFSVQKYGMLQWGDLFTVRQKLALTDIGTSALENLKVDSHLERLAVLAITRFTDDYSSLCRWMDRGTPSPTFARNALPVIWDFCEICPFDEASWSLTGSFDWTAKAVESFVKSHPGQAQQGDACASALPGDAVSVWFTDPPYYDAIPYSDMSDFFFVWQKRLLGNHPFLYDPYDPDNPLTPKACEAVQDDARLVDGKPKDRRFFEMTMGRAFREGRRVLQEDGISCVVFAHKTTEGWEALLTGMTRGGWTITGSWPVATERPGRLRSQDSAALATSVHLVCRPRPEDAPVGDWQSVLRELPKRVGDWIERLQSEGIRGADLVFACIGPALEIYSRYRHVEDAEGHEIPLGGDPEAAEPHRRGYLAYVWETVGRLALQQVLGTAEAKARNGAAGALEEDARLTALFLWTVQSTDQNGNGDLPADDTEGAEEEPEEDEENESGKGKKKAGLTLIYDVARRFAQPLGIHLEAWEGRIIDTQKGVVRLLPVRERAKQLFGEAGAGVAAERIERDANAAAQLELFPQAEQAPAIKTKGRRKKAAGAAPNDADLRTHREATTLDRIHAAMLLQSGGRANALRALLQAEKDRGPDFLRLANALSALYPKDSEEKRLVDAMLLAVPR